MNDFEKITFSNFFDFGIEGGFWDLLMFCVKVFVFFSIAYALLISFSEVLVKDLPTICANIKSI